MLVLLAYHVIRLVIYNKDFTKYLTLIIWYKFGFTQIV